MTNNGETTWTFETLRTSLLGLMEADDKAIRGLIEANDKRYAQMFTSSQEAVLAALNAAQTAVTAALSAAEKAVAKAEVASEKRFDAVNEFRATLADQQRTLMPRTEVELLVKAMQVQIQTNSKILSEMSGTRLGSHDTWAYIVGAIGILIALATWIMRVVVKP